MAVPFPLPLVLATQNPDKAREITEIFVTVAGVPRAARFATVAIARWPDGREVSRRGEVEGAITDAARGLDGFGYDPVFVPSEGHGRTFAEMAPEEKHAISHRGRAFRALVAALTEEG